MPEKNGKRKHGGGGGGGGNRRQPREKAYGVAQNHSDSDEMVVPVVGPNPYNGQPGYGQGYPTAPGGNVERGESHQSAVARETVEELQGRFQQMSFDPTPISSNVAGGSRYTVYPQTVSPANPPIQPAYGQERAFQESASVHQVPMSQLPRAYPHSNNTQILQSYAQRVGAPTNPTTMTPEQRRQYTTYIDPQNYPPQAIADSTRPYLQPPTQPQTSSNSNSSSSDGSDDGRGQHRHRSGHRSAKSAGPEAQKDWSQYQTKRDRDGQNRRGGGGHSAGGSSSVTR